MGKVKTIFKSNLAQSDELDEGDYQMVFLERSKSKVFLETSTGFKLKISGIVIGSHFIPSQSLECKKSDRGWTSDTE